jgi:replication initiation and membrane attachment protein DnaB
LPKNNEALSGTYTKILGFEPKKHLGCNAIAMYLYLLKLGNDNKGYDIIVSDVDVSKVLGLARNTIKPTKEKLSSIGLIQYENKKGRACSYQLLPDYDVQISSI